MSEKEFIDFFKMLFDEDFSDELTMDTEFRYLDDWCSFMGAAFIADMGKLGKSFSPLDMKQSETLGDLYKLYLTK